MRDLISKTFVERIKEFSSAGEVTLEGYDKETLDMIIDFIKGYNGEPVRDSTYIDTLILLFKSVELDYESINLVFSK